MDKSIKKSIKKKLKPLANFSRRVTAKLMKPVSDKIVADVRSSVNASIKLSAQQKSSLIPYYCGEKIRILFIFQMASLWPSWESFYESCMNDPNFSVTFTLLKEDNPVSMSQMLSAEPFLQSKGIPYVYFSDELIARTKPHVVVLQTPYDWYRQKHAKSDTLLRYGTRLIYITYGIEIADTAHAHKDHYTTAVRNCWRIYTFSDRMRADYAIYCNNGIAARACGHPKFDALFHKERFSLPEEVLSRAQGRKVILWHLHFPKFVIQKNKAPVMATPYLNEYIDFVKTVGASQDFFFIAQLHPKFMDCEEGLQNQAKTLVEELEKLPNVYFDRDDDYRPCLIWADYIITDRSAIMVEGAAAGVPILYMSNADYYEPMTEAVKPLVDSYAQGHTAEDMTAFVENCRNGLDPQKEAREKAFHECIPYFDGKCGERIKEDIAKSLMSPEQIEIAELSNMIKKNAQGEAREREHLFKALDDSFSFLNNVGSIEGMTPEEIDRLDGKLDFLETKLRKFRGEIESIRTDSTERDDHRLFAGVSDQSV